MYTVLTSFQYFLITCIHQPSFFVLTHYSHLDFNVYILVFSRFRQNGRKLLLSAQRRANSKGKNSSYSASLCRSVSAPFFMLSGYRFPIPFTHVFISRSAWLISHVCPFTCSGYQVPGCVGQPFFLLLEKG